MNTTALRTKLAPLPRRQEDRARFLPRPAIPLEGFRRTGESSVPSGLSAEPWEGVCFSIIIPFFDEAQNVGLLLEEVRCVAESLPGSYEVLAVDDGSRDATLLELENIAASWPSLRVVSHGRNRGQAAALWSGFGLASGQIVITLDGDGQNDPADIPRLLAQLQTGADLVAGMRTGRRDSPLRKGMSRLANAVRSRLLRDGIHDSGCALKAFRREVCTSFVPIRTLYSFMPALAVAAGFRVQEMPVNHRERKSGTSKYGLGVMLWRPLVDMLGIWWFVSRRLQEGRE